MRIPAAFLCLALGATAVHANPADKDVIDGFRTNDFMRMWPDEVDGLRQSSKQSDPSEHDATAEYKAGDGSAKALGRVYAWPTASPEPVKPGDEDVMKIVFAGVEELVEKQQKKPVESYSITSKGGTELSCREGEQKPGTRYVFCAVPIKGRVFEVQHISLSRDRSPEELHAATERFVGDLTDALVDAK